MAGGDWSPVILRNGTLFGYSPRMRFDLVVNIFSLYSALHGEIKIFGPGLQWRPYLHVRDCARAFAFFVEKERCRHTCYNVAHENRRVADLAEVFRGINPRLRVTHLQPADADRRDYRVDTGRLREEGFVTRVGLEEGAEEMVEAIVSGRIRDPESIYYRNAKWLKELTSLGSKNHTEILGFMETLTQLRPVSP
jgi:nucleoside-diphosphate-sugar epimerase